MRLGGFIPRGVAECTRYGSPLYDEIQYYELSLLHVYWLQPLMEAGDKRRALEAYRERVIVNVGRGVTEEGVPRDAQGPLPVGAALLRPGSPAVVVLYEEDERRLEMMVGAILEAGCRLLEALSTFMPVKGVVSVGGGEKQSMAAIAVMRRDPTSLAEWGVLYGC